MICNIATTSNRTGRFLGGRRAKIKEWNLGKEGFAPILVKNGGEGMAILAPPVPPALSETGLGWGGCRWSNSECRCFLFGFYWIMYQTPLWSWKKTRKKNPYHLKEYFLVLILHPIDIPIVKIVSVKIARAYVSMVSYLKNKSN